MIPIAFVREKRIFIRFLCCNDRANFDFEWGIFAFGFSIVVLSFVKSSQIKSNEKVSIDFFL